MEYGPGVPPSVENMTICTAAKDGGSHSSVCTWQRSVNVADATTSPATWTALPNEIEVSVHARRKEEDHKQQDYRDIALHRDMDKETASLAWRKQKAHQSGEGEPQLIIPGAIGPKEVYLRGEHDALLVQPFHTIELTRQQGRSQRRLTRRRSESRRCAQGGF